MNAAVYTIRIPYFFYVQSVKKNNIFKQKHMIFSLYRGQLLFTPCLP